MHHGAPPRAILAAACVFSVLTARSATADVNLVWEATSRGYLATEEEDMPAVDLALSIETDTFSAVDEFYLVVSLEPDDDGGDTADRVSAAPARGRMKVIASLVDDGTETRLGRFKARADSNGAFFAAKRVRGRAVARGSTILLAITFRNTAIAPGSPYEILGGIVRSEVLEEE